MLQTLASVSPDSSAFLSCIRPLNPSHISFPCFCFPAPELSVSEKFILWHFYLDIRVHRKCQEQHLAKAEDFFFGGGVRKCSLLLRLDTSINQFLSLFFRNWTCDNHNRPEEVPVWAARAVRSGGFKQQRLAWGHAAALIKQSGRSRRLDGGFVDFKARADLSVLELMF